MMQVRVTVTQVVTYSFIEDVDDRLLDDAERAGYERSLDGVVEAIAADELLSDEYVAEAEDAADEYAVTDRYIVDAVVLPKGGE